MFALKKIKTNNKHSEAALRQRLLQKAQNKELDYLEMMSLLRN